MADFITAAGDLINSVVGNLIDTITGNTKLDRLTTQDESDIKQYPQQKVDIRGWTTIPTDRTVQSYRFLLKYGPDLIEIPFNINPQTETISEPHAVTVTYTQGGGKIIHSDGMVTKDITITGTCGLYPGEKRNPLPSSGVGSGLEAFKQLQMVFRRYCFLRRYGNLQNNLQLIYINRRRQESWVVEPKVFTSEDSIANNFQFTYQIQLETLYPYDGNETKGLIENIMAAVPGWQQFDALVQRIGEAVDVLNVSVGQISAIVDGFGATTFSRVVSLVNAYADVKAGRFPNYAEFSRNSVKDTISQLRRAQTLLSLANAPEYAKQVADVERQITQSLSSNDELFDQNNTAVQTANLTSFQSSQQSNFFDSNGNAVSPTEATAAGAVTARPDTTLQFGSNQNSPLPLPGSATYQAQQAALEGLPTQSSATVGNKSLDLTASGAVIKNQQSDMASTAIPPTTRDIEAQLNWSATWDQMLANILPANADYRTVLVAQDDSLETLAYKVLGDHGRWVELAQLNNLRYPYVASRDYITANNLTNVIAYGDPILYPVPKVKNVNRQRKWRNEDKQSVKLTPFERALGSDIYIDEETGDGVWGDNDLVLAYGTQNISQFCRGPTMIKKGTYRRALNYGFSNFVGMSVDAIQSVLRAEARSIYAGDDRISSSEITEFFETAGVMLYKLEVRVVNQQQPITITGRV